MKKSFLLFLLAMGLFAFTTSAQTTPPTGSVPVSSIADSASYTGKYKYEGLPFDYMEISVKEGKLFFSGGEYNGPLNPLMDKKDVFDASGAAVFTFIRNGENKVSELRIDYQGRTYSGKREEKKS